MNRLLVRTAAAAGAITVCLGLSIAPASAQTDEHSGVQGVQGTQDVQAEASTPAVAVPAPAPEQSGSALPVTGSDVVTTAAIGIALVAGGTVLARRRAAVED